MVSQSSQTTAKPLLDIIVIWHPKDATGEQVFKRLQRHYHSPAFAGLAGGSVEVYSRSEAWDPKEPGSAPRPVPGPADTLPSAAQFTVLVPVIDEEMARSTLQESSPWSRYLSSVLTEDNHPMVVPVKVGSVDPPRGPLLHLLNSCQAVVTEPSSLAQTRPPLDPLSLERDISQAIVQKISPEWSNENPLKVFISHTKHGRQADQDVLAIVRQTIQGSRLHTFFDGQSIQTSSNWPEQIRDNARHCALLMVRTDQYATRQWTQEEVLEAKTNDVPVVALLALREGEERGCFLMDHVPTVAFSPSDPEASVSRALCRLVDETLKRVLWTRQDTFTADTGIDWKPVHAPEPVTVTAWLKRHPKDDKHLWIIHPDPPLTPNEKDLIRDMCELAGFDRLSSSLEILTPREFLARGGLVSKGLDPTIVTPGLALKGRTIALSVSPCKDLPRLGLNENHLDYAVAEIAQATFVHGGRLLYGGRIDKDYHDMTTFIAEQAQRYAQLKGSSILTEEDNDDRLPAFENLMPWYEFLEATKNNPDTLKNFARRTVGFGRLMIVKGDKSLDLAEAESLGARAGSRLHVDRASSLTDMRKKATKELYARVLIGGKIPDPEQHVVPGTLEEAVLTLEAGKPLYVCGGFGGIGAAVARKLGLPAPNGYVPSVPEDDAETTELLSRIASYRSRNETGLSHSETEELATSHHPSAIAGLVLRGLNRLAADTDNNLYSRTEGR